MSDKRFNIIFSGQIASGRSRDEVIQNVQARFKASPEKTAQLFSGKPVVVARNKDHGAAEQYCRVFEAAGAVCMIEEIPDQAQGSPAEQKKTSADQPPEASAKVACPKCGALKDRDGACMQCGIAKSTGPAVHDEAIATGSGAPKEASAAVAKSEPAGKKGLNEAIGSISTAIFAVLGRLHIKQPQGVQKKAYLALAAIVALLILVLAIFAIRAATTSPEKAVPQQTVQKVKKQPVRQQPVSSSSVATTTVVVVPEPDQSWLMGSWTPAHDKDAKGKELLIFESGQKVTWVGTDQTRRTGLFHVADAMLEFTFQDSGGKTEKLVFIIAADKAHLTSEEGRIYAREK